MNRTGILVLWLGLGFAVVPASAEPPGKTLSEISASAKQAYDAALKELGSRGAKARASAEAGDAAKWTPVNEAYAKQLAEIVGICERNVVALTRDATDLESTGAKPSVTAFTQYADVAGSMETARLQMIAFGNLLGRIPAADRATVLKALAPKYFVGKP
jgi:hypothetical protein